MLGWGGAHMLGWGRSAHAGVWEGFTCWGGGGAHMLGSGRSSHAGVGKGITGWSGLSLIYDEVIKRNLP